MRKVKEILRLKFDLKLGNRRIAQSCLMAQSAVSEDIRRFRRSSLIWPLPNDIDDNRLKYLLFLQPQIGSTNI
jgi:hypothetical protein